MNKNKTDRNIITFVILFIIILFLLFFRLIYSFLFLKDSFYVDEIWSYGLANSYYEPYVCVTCDQKDNINIDQWIPSTVFENYLTADQSNRFSYDSVYFNQVCDYHPPFYYIILHTICSFFPGEFSPWFGFSINIFSVIISEIFLYKTMVIISDSHICGILVCSFYSFSVGCLNTFIFIRMYALLTAITVCFLYFHAKLYYCKQEKSDMIMLCFFTLVGALTHHYFLFFAGIISLLFCLYYLFKKSFKKLLLYSLTMLSAALGSVLIFPATISHLLSGRIDDVKYPLNWQIAMAINCIIGELFGFSIPVCPNISYGAVGIVLLCSCVIISPLLFLLRKESWFINFLSLVKKYLSLIVNECKTMNLMILSMLCSTVGVVILVSFTVSFLFMGVYTDRYLFMIYPQVCILFVLGLKKLVSCFFKTNIIKVTLVAIILSVVCFQNNINSQCNYLFKKQDNAISISDYIKDSDCVFISLYHSTLTNVCNILMEADYIYSITSENLSDKINNIPLSPDSKKKVYFLVESRSFVEDNDESLAEENDGELSSNKEINLITEHEFVQNLKFRYDDVDCIGFDTLGEKTFFLYSVSIH